MSQTATHTPPARADTEQLSDGQIQHFHEQGYIMLPGFIDTEQQQRLRDDVDRLEADRQIDQARFLVEYHELGLLTSEPRMMEFIKPLMGNDFMMHHIHAVRQDAGNAGVSWHHDYEQCPQTNRSHCMVHIFYYLNGLNGDIGDLLLIPGTHKNIMDRGSLRQFETNDLPGSITVDDVPNGTAVIVHSALFHARRQKPGGEGRPRYFIDISYCERGVIWPGYHNQDKINEAALAANLGRNARYNHLYDTSQFFDRETVKTFDEKNVGSLCLKVK